MMGTSDYRARRAFRGDHMITSTASFRILLQGTTHYIIPLFQRPYSWRADNWKALWDDVLETYQAEPGSRHFLGSIVSKSLPGEPGGASRFLVIDGQQRLTTLTILLAALRDRARPSSPTLAEKINELYLTNKYAADAERHKLLPTQADRDAYRAVIDEQALPDPGVPVAAAYGYFRARLTDVDPEIGTLDMTRLEQVVMDGFELVSITLADADNEYRIFESLNATGEPLSQGDLLRNYLFMRIPAAKQDAVYHDLWLPLQQALGVQLTDFFRYSLMSSGLFVREGDVYQEWKRALDKLSPDALLESLEDIAREGAFYRRIISPMDEPDAGISRGLDRLNRWGGQTLYPFLLNLYRWRDAKELDEAGFVDILTMVESFLVRRLFARVPTNTLNRLFVRLAHQLPGGTNRVDGVRAALSDSGRRWPRDKDFRDGMAVYPLYLDSRPDQRRLILETLEADFGHKEPASLSLATIEHVMPQTLNQGWRDALGADAEEIHERFLHVLGNLTLSAYNAELGNTPFAQKRVRLADSGFQLNKEIAATATWTGNDIEERGRRLADRAVRIWPSPSDASLTTDAPVGRRAPGAPQMGAWDEATFMAALEAEGGAAVTAVARRVQEWSVTHGLWVAWGGGTRSGSMIPAYGTPGAGVSIVYLWTGGSVEVAFQYLRNWPPFDQVALRAELADRLNRIDGIAIPLDALDRRPSFSLSLLVNDVAMDQFIETLDWAFGLFQSTWAVSMVATVA